MANGIKTGNPREINEVRSSKFRVGSWIQQTPEEVWRTYRPKLWGNNIKDVDSPKPLMIKTINASSQNVRQLMVFLLKFLSWRIIPPEMFIHDFF